MSVSSKYRGPINPINPPPDGEARISIYGYTPSAALAGVALATFGIVFIAHSFYSFRCRRTRLFQFLLAFGCAMELVGYGFRIGSNKNPFLVIDFVIQYFMIVCAPVFYTTAYYLALLIAVRQLRPTSLHISPLSPKLMLIVFASIDIVTTALQIVGAALIGVSESDRANGKTPPISTDAANNILLAGLAIQNFSFLIFLTILAVIVLRNSRMPASKEGHSDRLNAGPEDPAQVERLPLRFLIVIAVSSLALFLRTLFRLAETAEGVFGFASTHEALFGTLEYTPVIISLGLWAVSPLYRLLGIRKNV